ncbi:MAG: SURF1 family protein [Rubrivivax sp.]|nr:SURF1 family protein [Rubrivivax sp.]
MAWLAGLALVLATLHLGLWQLDRAAQKLRWEQDRADRARMPVLDAAGLPATLDEVRAAEHRVAVVAGRWLAGHTIYLDNRPMAGRVGFIVLTPLGLADGRVLLVQRGWWPRDPVDRARIAAPLPPAGEVQVRGRIALAPPRHAELAAETGGPIRQNVDVSAYAAETRLALLPCVVVQLDDDAGASPVSDGLGRQWPAPASDVHKHYGYAVQWFSLAGLTLGLLVWFRLVRPWRRRRRRDHAE